jgi:putative addiction module component (TIGR02574 family)
MELEYIMNLHELTPSEKILLAEGLWDSVASDEQLFPLTEDQKKELDVRLTRYSIDPEAGDSWENVRNRISST